MSCKEQIVTVDNVTYDDVKRITNSANNKETINKIDTKLIEDSKLVAKDDTRYGTVVVLLQN
jgi:hypothetical protein